MAVSIEDNGNIGLAFEQDEEETHNRRGRTIDNEIVSPYEELLMRVESKYHGETRHETALRYIREMEAGSTPVPATNQKEEVE